MDAAAASREERDMRKWLAWLTGMLMLAGSVGHAAVVTLRNGQKVEGEFAGATSEALSVTVGSQTLEFPVREVLSVVFPAPVGEQPGRAATTPPRGEDRQGKVWAEAQGLVKAALEGLPREEFGSRLEQVSETYRGLSGQGVGAGFREGMEDALGHLHLARSVWDAKVSRKGREALSENPYLDRCAGTDPDLQTVVKPEDDALKRGIGAAVVGPRPFFSCAEAALGRAKAASTP